MNSSQRLAVITVASAIGAGCALLVLLNPRLVGRYLLEEVGMGLVMGTLFGQITLAAAWNAFGPLPLLRRLPLSLAWVATLVVAFGISISLVDHAPISMILVILTGIFLGLWLLVQLPLWYFVLVRGWRLRNRNEAAAIPDVRLRYFGIRELMVLIAVLAALFGAGWATFVYLETYDIYGTSREVAVQILMSAMMVVITVPLVVAALLPRGAILATVVMALIMGAATLGEVLLFKSFDLDLGPFGQTTLLPVINASTGAWVCVVILGVRLSGYSLGTAQATVPASPAKRRWLPRFGLRTLLVTMTALGIGLGYVGMLLQRVRHQRQIVAKIEAAGGEVRYNWQFGMGTDLDLDPDSAPNWILEMDLAGNLKSRYRTDSKGRTVERQFETPSGPKFVRIVLGDDIFAHVESVDFFTSEFKPAKELDPQLLLELPELKVVCLTYGQVNDEWLGCVAQVPQLRFLSLLGYTDGTATGDGMARLRSAQHLESLGIHGEWVQDETVTGVAHLRQLKSLSFNEVPNLTSAMFANLDELTDLRELFIRRAKKIDDQEAEHLRRLHKLRALWLIDTSISDATLAHLTGLKQLEYLDLSVTNVGDSGMEHVAMLPKLKILRIGDTKVTDAGMLAIARLTQLETLHLWPTSVSDGGLLHLRTLKNLKKLSVGPNVTKEGADELRNALPYCELLRIDENGRGLH